MKAERVPSRAAASSRWRKSSYSDPNGGSCLEVLDGCRAVIPVRDSKVPHGPVLVFPGGVWASFVAHLKN
ncbi:DUF397 domain-containing protein [Streptomyces sp. NPDC029526]|uniref:DUF397 domain-containing protein n=1 Tax=Streptomyces sp. NPDC029526 TaxID=3155728 RepID=UPI0033C7A770